MRAFDGVRRSSGRPLTSRSSGKYMPRSKSWSRASGAALSSPRLLMEREAFVIARVRTRGMLMSARSRLGRRIDTATHKGSST